jgi:hypothetical protein
MDAITGELSLFLLLALVALVIAIVQGLRSDLKTQKCCRFTVIGITCIGAAIPTMIVSGAISSDKTMTGRILQYAAMCLLFGGGGIVGGIGIWIDRARRRAESSELQKRDLPPEE